MAAWNSSSRSESLSISRRSSWHHTTAPSPRLEYTQIARALAHPSLGCDPAEASAILSFMADVQHPSLDDASLSSDSPETSPTTTDSPSSINHSARQIEALLEVTETIAQQRDLKAPFHHLAER